MLELGSQRWSDSDLNLLSLTWSRSVSSTGMLKCCKDTSSSGWLRPEEASYRLEFVFKTNKQKYLSFGEKMCRTGESFKLIKKNLLFDNNNGDQLHPALF